VFDPDVHILVLVRSSSRNIWEAGDDDTIRTDVIKISKNVQKNMHNKSLSVE
jgi:hypothetical protein